MDQTEHSDLDSVLQLLARQTDEEKLAGLLLLTQRVDFHKLQGNEPEPEAARQKVYKSIGRKFIRRLLKSTGADGAVFRHLAMSLLGILAQDHSTLVRFSGSLSDIIDFAASCQDIAGAADAVRCLHGLLSANIADVDATLWVHAISGLLSLAATESRKLEPVTGADAEVQTSSHQSAQYCINAVNFAAELPTALESKRLVSTQPQLADLVLPDSVFAHVVAVAESKDAEVKFAALQSLLHMLRSVVPSSASAGALLPGAWCSSLRRAMVQALAARTTLDRRDMTLAAAQAMCVRYERRIDWAIGSAASIGVARQASSDDRPRLEQGVLVLLILRTAATELQFMLDDMLHYVADDDATGAVEAVAEGQEGEAGEKSGQHTDDDMPPLKSAGGDSGQHTDDDMPPLKSAGESGAPTDAEALPPLRTVEEAIQRAAAESGRPPVKFIDSAGATRQDAQDGTEPIGATPVALLRPATEVKRGLDALSRSERVRRAQERLPRTQWMSGVCLELIEAVIRTLVAQAGSQQPDEEPDSASRAFTATQLPQQDLLALKSALEETMTVVIDFCIAVGSSEIGPYLSRRDAPMHQAIMGEVSVTPTTQMEHRIAQCLPILVGCVKSIGGFMAEETDMLQVEAFNALPFLLFINPLPATLPAEGPSPHQAVLRACAADPVTWLFNGLTERTVEPDWQKKFIAMQGHVRLRDWLQAAVTAIIQCAAEARVRRQLGKLDTPAEDWDNVVKQVCALSTSALAVLLNLVSLSFHRFGGSGGFHAESWLAFSVAMLVHCSRLEQPAVLRELPPSARAAALSVRAHAVCLSALLLNQAHPDQIAAAQTTLDKDKMIMSILRASPPTTLLGKALGSFLADAPAAADTGVPVVAGSEELWLLASSCAKAACTVHPDAAMAMRARVDRHVLVEVCQRVQEAVQDPAVAMTVQPLIHVLYDGM